jgi:tetratricopeptide (TPR) repeat protein
MNQESVFKNANQLKRQGSLDQAIALYQEIIDGNPHFAWGYANLGDALAQQGKLDEAIAQ